MLKYVNKGAFFPLPNKNKRIEKIYYSDIMYLEGRINYTLIHLQDGRVKISPRTMLYHINNSLDDSFVRIHRAFCINKIYLKDYMPQINPNFLWLVGDVKLSVSRRKQKYVLENL
jgi:DNA-binding LytR/AlgR family response regulator